MEDLNKLYSFVRVAERRSFTKAARDLRLTPSTLTKHINELEGRLRLSLLTRSTRGVCLTEAGEALYARCVQIVGGLDEALAIAGRLHSLPQGTLRIHAVSGSAHWVVAPLLPDFLRACPDLTIELLVGGSGRLLAESATDLVIRSKTLPDPGLANREIGPVPYVVCAAPAYVATHGLPRQPGELAGHNCLVHLSYATRDWPFLVGGRETAIAVRGNFRSDSPEALLQAALRGAGIARLPAYVVAEAIADCRLLPLFAGLICSHQTMRVYFSDTPYLPAKIRLFLDFLQERMGATPRPPGALPPASARRRGEPKPARGQGEAQAPSSRA